MSNIVLAIETQKDGAVIEAKLLGNGQVLVVEYKPDDEIQDMTAVIFSEKFLYDMFWCNEIQSLVFKKKSVE